jgi:hypothetical protein
MIALSSARIAPAWAVAFQIRHTIQDCLYRAAAVEAGPGRIIGRTERPQTNRVVAEPVDAADPATYRVCAPKNGSFQRSVELSIACYTLYPF